MSIERRKTSWFDTPSFIAGRNLTPLVFMDLIAELMRQIRPDISCGLHQGTQLDFSVPHLSMELRDRTTVASKTPTFVANVREGTLHRQFYSNVFRFRMYAATQAQAESDASWFERMIHDYIGFIRGSGVDAISFTRGMGRDLDRDGRVEGAFHAARDYTVTLGELWLKRAVPINHITLRSYSEYELITQTVTQADYATAAGLVDDALVYVSEVYQGPYVFVEGLDYAVVDGGIKWLTEQPPVPYVITYYRPRLRGSAEIDLPAPPEVVGS